MSLLTILVLCASFGLVLMLVFVAGFMVGLWLARHNTRYIDVQRIERMPAEPPAPISMPGGGTFHPAYPGQQPPVPVIPGLGLKPTGQGAINHAGNQPAQPASEAGVFVMEGAKPESRIEREERQRMGELLEGAE